MTPSWFTKLPLTHITNVSPVGGGDVNLAYRIDTSEKCYFLLVQPHRHKDFYTSEIAGLEAFKAADILAPQVIASGEIEHNAYLLLNYLPRGAGKQEELGALVARLHHRINSAGTFGFQTNYTGAAITFDNAWCRSWSELFVSRRLDVLAAALIENGAWSAEQESQYQHVRRIIVDALSVHKSTPSLLHGDLWGGNYMFLDNGLPALIDPAVMYGDREFDIGITTVFGGFSDAFYQSYQQAFPLDTGYETRLLYYRLYYLMLHLHKFGNTYASSVSHTMADIVAGRYYTLS